MFLLLAHVSWSLLWLVCLVPSHLRSIIWGMFELTIKESRWEWWAAFPAPSIPHTRLSHVHGQHSQRFSLVTSTTRKKSFFPPSLGKAWVGGRWLVTKQWAFLQYFKCSQFWWFTAKQIKISFLALDAGYLKKHFKFHTFNHRAQFNPVNKIKWLFREIKFLHFFVTSFILIFFYNAYSVAVVSFIYVILLDIFIKNNKQTIDSYFKVLPIYTIFTVC